MQSLTHKTAPGPMSRLYRGDVWHKRHQPAEHSFRYRLTYLYIDLAEIDRVAGLSPLFSIDRFNLGAFYRTDYLPSRLTLREEVIKLIAQQTGEIFSGAIRLLALPRSVHFNMNPIALFFCFDDAETLRYVVAEVTNTPWGERFRYVVDMQKTDANTPKKFHVSPFMPLGLNYQWQISDPGEHLSVSIRVSRHETRLFDASMKLTAIPLTPLRLTIGTLLQPQKTLAGIYLEAVRLWRKKVPFYPHPGLRQKLIETLDEITGGRIVVEDGTARYEVGTGDDATITVRILDEQFYTRLIAGGSVGAAEAYIHGDWQCDDLTGLLRLLHRNREVLKKLNAGAWRRALYWFRHKLNRDTLAGSKRNIAAHYDLGNDLFQRFLDPTMTYSSGIFADASTSMEQASIAKLDRLCRQLELSAEDHVLEIGTGWGSFAIHAASRYGCRVTTTTISDEQFRLASERIRDAGVDHLVTVLDQDYRQLTGRYDKLVSIEMIEAVGLDHLESYFSQCAHLLKPHGRMGIQAITIADQHFDEARRNSDFIQQFIFPGGALPSVTELTRTATIASDLRLYDLVDISEHYATTIRHWRDRFNLHLDELAELGYDDRFQRMWDYYFCYCEAGFEERHIGCVQAAFHRPGWRGALPVAG